MEEAPDHWTDDLLGRRENASFLTRMLIQRFQTHYGAPGADSLCFALDADWGAGKSFFVQRWSKDLSNLGHPAIHFDAWANDLSDDPLIGFLAQLKKELVPWVNKRGKADALKIEFKDKLNTLIKQSGKAVIPVTTIVAKGVLKKFVGIATDEVVEAFSGSTESDSSSSNVSAEAVDTYLEVAMKAHSDRQTAIRNFRTELESLVDFLVEATDAKLPMVVFVDELDRCRPDYAISLLEGMKHLLNCRGVVFAVSTNIRQLSSAIRAIYGQDFDSRLYLKKFFAFEYLLPSPSGVPYANFLMSGSVFSTRYSDGAQVHGCLPFWVRPNGVMETISQEFAYVAEAMQLDLRSQKQILLQAESAISGYQEGRAVPFLYLFYLAALRHKSLEIFDRIFANRETGLPPLPRNLPLQHRWKIHGEVNEINTSLQHVLECIHAIVFADPREAYASYSHSRQQYPNEILGPFVSDSYQAGRQITLRIATLPMLVRQSGYITNSDSGSQ